MSRLRPPANWVWLLAVDRPGTMHEVILDELRSVILAGQAPPGAPIVVDDIAERFGASRIPVREALKTLVGEGLVDHAPRSGYSVARLTRAELAELYVVREALENAALGISVKVATPEDDLAVAAAYDALTAAIERHDLRAQHRESRRFHLALVQPCRMQRVLRMFEAAWNVTEPCQPMSHIGDELRVALHSDHEAMKIAFRDRRFEELTAASTRHYRRLQDVVETLPGDTGLFL